MAIAAALPLGRYQRFRTADVGRAREEVARIYCDHRLSPVERVPELDAVQNHVSLGAMSLSAIQYGAPVRIDAGELTSFYLVLMPLRGRAQVVCGRQEHVCSAKRASVLSATGQVAMEWERGCQQLVLWFGKDALQQHLSTLLGRSLTAPLQFTLEMPLDTPIGQSWTRAVHFLLDELEAPSSWASNPAALEHYERTLMSALLYAQPHNYSERLHRQGPDLAPSSVRKAESYFERHVHDDVSIEELAMCVGVSRRTLYDNFNKFRGSSPLQYLRSLRLAGARKDLLEACPGDSVTSIALKWRFTELGRFSQLYRQRYGELPSVTLRRRCVD